MEWLKGDRNVTEKSAENTRAKIKFKALETDEIFSDSHKLASVSDEISDSINSHINYEKYSCQGAEEKYPGSVLSFVSDKKSVPDRNLNQIKVPVEINTGKSLPVDQPVYYQRISHHALIAILIAIGVAFMIMAAFVYELYFLWIPALIISFLLLILIGKGHKKIKNGEAGGMFFIALAYLLTLADIILSGFLMVIAFFNWLIS